MLRAGLCVPGGTLLHQFATGLQVQRAEETGPLPPRVDRHDGRAAALRPDAGGGGLQVQAGLVAGQDHGVGGVLGDVDEFFSSRSSKSMICSLLWDRYTF